MYVSLLITKYFVPFYEQNFLKKCSFTASWLFYNDKIWIQEGSSITSES